MDQSQPSPHPPRRVLLVAPRFPVTYWGFEYGLSLYDKDATLPPLGILTLAAHLPKSWELKLWDLNVQKQMDEELLDWAEIMMVGGMRIQNESMHEVLDLARQRDCLTVIGGPAPTTAPQEWDDAHIVFCGEIEGREDELLAAVAAPEPHHQVCTTSTFPDLNETRVPRFDLVNLNRYSSVGIQYSRGCPFVCEFCDIVELFGRRPRVKSNPQVLKEMQAVLDQGYRGTLFFVDDNFVGNKPAVKKLLPEVAQWQAANGFPYQLYTEASINLADDEELLDLMVDARFQSVFVGIESPSPEALADARKSQNLKVNLQESLETLTGRGFEIMGGFILGFDSETHEIFELHRSFIQESAIPLAMVGLLMALPGTALWKRLEDEGRLHKAGTGDQFGRPNFDTTMDPDILAHGYGKLLLDLYNPDAYYDRCEDFILRAGRQAPRRRSEIREVFTVFRTAWAVGVRAPWRMRYWRLLYKVFRHRPDMFAWAMGHVVMGEHMIRYTRQDILPRLRAQNASSPPQEPGEVHATA